MAFPVRARRALTLAISLIAVYACDKITSPLREAGDRSAASVMGLTGRVLVTPDSMRGWGFVDDQLGVPCTDSTKCQLIAQTSPASTGGGSAELATSASTDAIALQLPDYRGTRLSQISELSYSTFAVSNSGNVAPSLKLVVDYDVTDASQGDQGRLVYDPTGFVPLWEWKRWDAKAGLWWGTKSSVTRGNKNTKNPCVQTSKCTWSQLLATFPNLGVHPTTGAILLEAGPGLASFRADVDSLTINIGSGATTFDFEAALPAPTTFHRLRVIPTSSGVVFNAPLSRDTMLPVGAVVSYSFYAAAGMSGAPGDLLTVLDDTIAPNAGSITMDADHTIYAEVEYPLTSSPTVADLTTRLRDVVQSTQPQQALADFMTWYAAQTAASASPAALKAALDTAQFLALDPVADSSVIDAFTAAVSGTEFYFSPYQPGHVYFHLPAPQPQTSLIGGKSIDSASLLRVQAGRLAAVSSRLTRPTSVRDALGSDAEPDEPTQIIYVNGIFTLADSPADGEGSATATMGRLKQEAESWQRFGLNPGLRDNVHVSVVYNESEMQVVRDYKKQHACETKAGRSLRMFGWLHVLKRFAECKAVPLILHVADSDLVEAFQQIRQLQGDGGPITKDAWNLANVVNGYHNAGVHTLLVGHSQGNLVIAQAVQVLPTFKVTNNVGNGCTAVMALASPVPARRFYQSLESQYVHGLITDGDILLQLPGGIVDNDFPRITTPASGLVALQPSAVAKLQQGIKAHFMEDNYLLYPPSSIRLGTEMTQLSDECSVGTFEVTAGPSQMTVHDTARLAINLRSRTGKPLYGRTFQGGTDVAYVSGMDSTIFATNISDLPTTLSIGLYNTTKLKASFTLNHVLKRAIDASVTYVSYLPPDQPPDGAHYWNYTVTVRRADGGLLTWAKATPLDPQEGNLGTWAGSNALSTEAVASYLDMWGDLPPSTRWEVRTYDGSYHVPMYNLIGVDTVTATSGSSASNAIRAGNPRLALSGASDAFSQLDRRTRVDGARPVTMPRVRIPVPKEATGEAEHQSPAPKATVTPRTFGRR